MEGGCISKSITTFLVQCSASGNKVYIYKDTLIEGRLGIGKNLAYSNNWLDIHTTNTNGNGFTGAMSFAAYGG